MIREILESYQSNKRLIEKNNKKIEDEKCKEMPSVIGKVKGSSHEFPYIERRFSVQMDEPIQADKSNKKIRKWEYEIRKAEKDMNFAEQFIESIKKTQHREILSYRYIDGMKVKEIADKVGYSHSRISQIISYYVKD